MLYLSQWGCEEGELEPIPEVASTLEKLLAGLTYRTNSHSHSHLRLVESHRFSCSLEKHVFGLGGGSQTTQRRM